MTHGGYMQAAVCRRGHVIDDLIEPAVTRREPLPKHCKKCGALVLTECPQCTTRIQGSARGAVAWEWNPPDFCHQCGSPYPWVSREGIAYQIENLLEADDLPQGDRRVLVEQLASLREPAGDAAVENRQMAALRLLKSGAPKAWALAGPVLQGILTAEMRRQLGLPPA